VAFIIAMVTPVGDRSIAMTRDCFEPASAFLPLGSAAVCCGGLAAVTGAVDDAVGDRFFMGFDMEILRSVIAASRRTTESPTSAIKPAGQDLWTLLAPGIGKQYRSNRGRMPVLSEQCYCSVRRHLSGMIEAGPGAGTSRPVLGGLYQQY
jgi:hypothetical protein